MKTEIDYLPEHKQQELTHLVEMITATYAVEMIILFGSYARNDWVEEKYDDEHYRYQSDFDLLVIIENKSEFTQAKLERDLESQIDQAPTILTPVIASMLIFVLVKMTIYKVNRINGYY